MDQSRDVIGIVGLRALYDRSLKPSLSLTQLFKVFEPLNSLISARQEPHYFTWKDFEPH